MMSQPFVMHCPMCDELVNFVMSSIETANMTRIVDVRLVPHPPHVCKRPEGVNVADRLAANA